VTPRRITAVAAALTFALGLGACTSEVGGQANPSATGAATTTPGATSSTVDPDSPFAGVKPCTVVDQALSGQGFPAAVPTVAYSKEGCAASKPTSGDTPGVDVALALQPGLKYKDNVGNPSQASEGTVNGRPAVEEREPLGSPGQCAVRLPVRDSRALVVVTSGSDTPNSCKLVEGFAEKIEPLLPKNN
jgi:hypothetical protein